MNPPREREGTWIFVSHSHQDWEKVRRVRNLLEELGHKPLLFFLKCLNDDCEVDGLIRREITARNWFLLCDSVSAQRSRWVQAEMKIIKDLEPQGKAHETIHLDSDWEIQVQKVALLLKRATVFVCSAPDDQEIARQIAARLVDSEYCVYGAGLGLSCVEDFLSVTERGIDECVTKGFFLLVLSPEAVQAPLSNTFRGREIKYVVSRCRENNRCGNIVPVVVRDPEKTLQLMSPDIKGAIANSPWFDLTFGNFDARVSELIRTLRAWKIE